MLARLEELRDEALSIIMTKFQCAARGYLALCEYKRRKEQRWNCCKKYIYIYKLIKHLLSFDYLKPIDYCRVGLLIVQRNVRAWCTLRNWTWFKLFGRVKPMIKGNKKDEEFEALEKKYKELEEEKNKEEKRRKELESETDRYTI